jgi:hypothetical protein
MRSATIGSNPHCLWEDIPPGHMTLTQRVLHSTDVYGTANGDDTTLSPAVALLTKTPEQRRFCVALLVSGANNRNGYLLKSVDVGNTTPFTAATKPPPPSPMGAPRGVERSRSRASPRLRT